MGLMGAMRGNAIGIVTDAPVPKVVDAVVTASTGKPKMFGKSFSGKPIDTGAWAEHIGSDWGLEPGQVLAVVSCRPGLEHEVVALSIDGTVALAFFIDGAPDMAMVSFGRGQAKWIAKKTVEVLSAGGFQARCD